ncbi:hypothetical protein C823_005193 [Eubacterium plexicaudatum ASF492]|uniref:Uncharacterized protein n=1 Tax=Eubacterium plexicaudatum ASF492 TaxID=1235802 RepID=N2B0R4_9FIRM|nr:hypothetical protein C823_005193 [Eubacterium plexicaudatum ASF492]
MDCCQALTCRTDFGQIADKRQDICPYIRLELYLANMGHMLENGDFGFRLLPA